MFLLSCVHDAPFWHISLSPSPPSLSPPGGVRDAAPGEDKEDIINEASKQELALTLTNKFEATSDDSSDMKALFVRTKRMVVDLLRVQPGDNLTDILYTPATPEQEEEHQRMIKEREESEKLNKSLPVSQLQSDSVYTDREWVYTCSVRWIWC